MQVSKLFNEYIYDFKVYYEISFSFAFVDEAIVYILIFMQLLIFIGISKNLGYNVRKI